MAAGDITDALVDELGIRLEDADEAVFTEATKLLALNRGQVMVCQYLDNHYLTELETIDDGVGNAGEDISGGSFAFSSLDNTPLKGAEGIIATSVQVGGSGDFLWATEIDTKRRKRLENTYLVESDVNILYYIYASTIYYELSTYTSSVAAIYYLKVPTTMTTDVDPVINTGLHEIMLLFAEGYCWGMDGKLERREKAFESAKLQCKVLNEKYTPPTEIGTKGRIELGRGD